jgi:drug/metabolite transporter (DMT)-like permease
VSPGPDPPSHEAVSARTAAGGAAPADLAARRRAKIVAAFAAVYLVWGSTYLGIRIAIETLPPLVMAGVRYATAGVLLYAWTRWRNPERPRPAHWRSALVIGGLLLLGGNGAVSWSEQRVASGLAALIISTVPLWIVLLQWLRPGGRRPPGRVLLGVAIGLVGIWLLVRPRGGAASHLDPVGVGVLIAGALSWSVGSLLSRRLPLPRSPLLGIAMEMIGGGALLIAGGLAIGEGPRIHPGAVSARSLAALLYLIFFGSLIGFTCYVWLLRVSTPSKVATYAFVNPVVAVLLGWAFAGEPFGARTALATTVIVAAVAIITLVPQRGERGAEAKASDAPQEPLRTSAHGRAVVPSVPLEEPSSGA